MVTIVYGSGSVRGFEKILEEPSLRGAQGIVYNLTHYRQFVFDSRAEEDLFTRKRTELEGTLAAAPAYAGKGFREAVNIAAEHGTERGMYGAEAGAYKEWQDRLLHRFRARQRDLRVWSADKMKGDVFVLMGNPNQLLGVDNTEIVDDMGGHRFRYGDNLEGSIGPYKVICISDLRGTIWESAHKGVDILVSRKPVKEDTAVPRLRLTAQGPNWYIQENLAGDKAVNSSGEAFVIDVEDREVTPYTFVDVPGRRRWNPFVDAFTHFDIYGAVEAGLPFRGRGPWEKYVDSFAAHIRLANPTQRQRARVEKLLRGSLRNHFSDEQDFQEFLEHANRTQEIGTEKV